MVKLSDYDHLKNYKTADRALGDKNSKTIGNNTELVRRNDGSIVVELHGHGIVKYLPEHHGRIRLSSAGYRTSTTKDRINRYTPSNVSVVQRQGVWYLKENSRKQEFYDGIEVTV